MSFSRHRGKTSEWRAWVRQYGSALSEHGLPLDAVRNELDWFLFLDHGYIQSAERSPADWWTIRLLSADQAMRLAKFIQEIHPGQYPELVASLRRGATSFPVAEQGCASNRDARMFAVDKSPLVDEIVTVRTGSAGMSVDSRWGNVGSPSERLGR